MKNKQIRESIITTLLHLNDITYSTLDEESYEYLLNLSKANLSELIEKLENEAYTYKQMLESKF
jgi:hypothetical protein